MEMAKRKSNSKSNGRPKSKPPKAGFTKTKRDYGKGGKLK